MKITMLVAGVALVCAAPTLKAERLEINTTLPSGQCVTVKALSANVVKVINTAKGESAGVSRASVIDGSSVDGTVTRTGDIATFTTPGGVTAMVNTRTGEVVITSGPGRTVTDNGLRVNANGERVLKLNTEGVGSFYGAGERGYHLNLAGDTLVMYNKQNYGYTGGEKRIKQMNITMPLFLSSNGYAIVFDDYAAARMIMGNPIEYITESHRPVSWYFVNGGGSLKGVTRALTALTGRQALPPLWSLGYITSKYGYHDEAETRGVVDTLKRENYPLDGLVLDLYWYGKEQDMGRLAWDPDQWPDYKKMLADLKKDNVNVVTISQPYVLRNGRGIDNYNMGVANGLFVKDATDSLGGTQEVKIWVGEGGMWDVSNPATRKWLAERYKQLTIDGVGGWWGDLGEPEVHPETGLHANGLTTRQYHNQYGNDWSEIIYDLYNEQFPDTRLMTMMRGGTTGLQRYSVYPWSTDVSRSWGGLAPQVIIMLNSGLSGLGYMGHDVGGFAINADNPIDPELYVRWLQLGLFSPVLRTHAQAYAEPYHYPEQASIIKPLIRERYRWLPYNYTLAYENATEGAPLVRPLNFYEPGSNAYDDITDEYLWGADVLVAPVMKQGATERQITFPAGTWVDYSDPSKVYAGHSTITYPAPLEVLPLFVRAGAIIPSADYTMQSTADYRTDRYTFNVYPVEGCSGEYTLYEDDLASPRSLAEGKYSLIKATDAMSDGTLTLTLGMSSESPITPAAKDVTFIVNNIAKAPASVTLNGRKVSAKYDKKAHTLTIKGRYDLAATSTIVVKL